MANLAETWVVVGRDGLYLRGLTASGWARWTKARNLAAHYSTQPLAETAAALAGHGNRVEQGQDVVVHS